MRGFMPTQRQSTVVPNPTPRSSASSHSTSLSPSDACSQLMSLEVAQEALGNAQEHLRVNVLSRLRASGVMLESNDDGPEVVGLDNKDVDPMALLQQLSNQPKSPLSRDDVSSVLNRMMALYRGKKTPSLVDVAVPRGPGARLIVVGDLHGQLEDLLWIFHQYGVPTPSNAYVFAGDICDRGDHSVEIWVLVFAFLLRYPRSVTIIRGNHENASLNHRPRKFGGGFVDSCEQRYEIVPFLYKRFSLIFLQLPLFVLIAKKIFVVHAGLSRVPSVTLDKLRNLDHSRHYPASRTQQQIKQRMQLKWTEEEAIIFDSQWADPHDGNGLIPSPRGLDAIKFGKDITTQFCSLNAIDLVIRAHEVPDDLRGVSYAHDKKLLTVYSASNYRGIKNAGGVALLSYAANDALSVSTSEYFAPTLDKIPTLLGSARNSHGKAVSRVQDALLKNTTSAPWALIEQANGQSLGSLDEESHVQALDVMVERAQAMLCAHRDDLLEFCSANAVQPGLIDANIFALQLGRYAHVGWDDANIWLPVLSDGLHAIQPDGTLNYETLLSRFRVNWSLWASETREKGMGATAAMRHLTATLLSAQLSVEEAMALFDVNLSKTVNLAECRSMLMELLPSLGHRQQHIILQRLHTSWGGTPEVQAIQFLVALCREFPAPRPETASNPPSWLNDTLVRSFAGASNETEVFNTLGLQTSVAEALADIFQKSDVTEDIIESLRRVLEIDDEGRTREFVDYLEATGASKLSFLEVLQKLVVLDECSTGSGSSGSDDPGSSLQSARPRLSEDVRSTLLAVLKIHRSILLTGCRALDTDMTSKIGRLEFIEVVQALLLARNEHNSVNPNSAASKMPDIEDLRSCLPAQVEYIKLLSSLHIVDKASDH